MYNYTHPFARFEHYANIDRSLIPFVRRLQDLYKYWDQPRFYPQELLRWHSDAVHLYKQLKRHVRIPFQLRKEVIHSIERMLHDIDYRFDEDQYGKSWPSDEFDWHGDWDGYS